MSILNKIRQRLQLLLSTKSSRRNQWPVTKSLGKIHIKNCRVLEHRTSILEEIPKGGICAEVGIWKCDYSRKISETLKPEKLHLIDIDPASIKIAREVFREEIQTNAVEVHHQDSSKKLRSMPENWFDWIYIDGDHSYEGVKKDLEASHRTLKPEGMISLNDYIFFGSSDLTKYGVIEAVNEFCIDHHYELIHLALHGRMYNDVTIRKIQR